MVFGYRLYFFLCVVFACVCTEKQYFELGQTMFRLVSKFAIVLRKVDNTIYIEIFAPFSFSPLLPLTVGNFKMSEFEQLILCLTFLCLGI